MMNETNKLSKHALNAGAAASCGAPYLRGAQPKVHTSTCILKYLLTSLSNVSKVSNKARARARKGSKKGACRHGENMYTYRDLITTRGWFCLSIRRRYSNAHNKIRGFIFSYPITQATSVRLTFILAHIITSSVLEVFDLLMYIIHNVLEYLELLQVVAAFMYSID